MTEEAFVALRDRIDSDHSTIRIVEFTEEEVSGLTKEQAGEIVALFGANTLISLPARERTFFEWLHTSDASVWEDLWGDAETPYLVSLSFLPDVLPKGRGFVICDLVNQQNFNFAVENITPEDGTGLLDAAMEIVKANGKLQLHQAFLIEIWRAPIDQWRFAWLYNVSLDVVKEMVIWMISEHILTLPSAEPESVDSDEPESGDEA